MKSASAPIQGARRRPAPQTQPEAPHGPCASFHAGRIHCHRRPAETMHARQVVQVACHGQRSAHGMRRWRYPAMGGSAHQPAGGEGAGQGGRNLRRAAAGVRYGRYRLQPDITSKYAAGGMGYMENGKNKPQVPGPPSIPGGVRRRHARWSPPPGHRIRRPRLRSRGRCQRPSLPAPVSRPWSGAEFQERRYSP